MAFIVAEPGVGNWSFAISERWNTACTRRDLRCRVRRRSSADLSSICRSMRSSTWWNRSAWRPTSLLWLAHSSCNLRRACALQCAEVTPLSKQAP